MTDNPLLATEGLPDFEHILPEHVEPAVRALLTDSERRLAELEATLAPTWDAIVPPLDDLGRAYERTWGPVTHLFGVRNSDELRAAYEKVLPDVVSFGLKLRQSEPIYQALKALREGSDWATLNEPQQRIIQRKLLSAELAGIGLSAEKRARFNEIARELSKLGSDYSNHVLDATKAYELVIRDPADAEGLPLSLRRIAAQSYNERKPVDEPEATPESGP
ncbi:MAG: M3 family peptidase, partial [Planctomycetaceae bacterium]|nr:M3 family peptidase [Planctomycetaceae bacterium]